MWRNKTYERVRRFQAAWRHWRETAIMVCLIVCVSVPAMAAGTDKDDLFYWLFRSNAGAKTQNYHGVVHYYRYGETSRPMTIVHVVDEGIEQAMIEMKDCGTRQVRWENGEVNAYIQSADGTVKKVRMPKVFSLQSLSPDQIAVISSYYGVIDRAEEHILGRRADRILIAAKDQDRYSYKAWIDRQTGVLLRGELVDKSGQVIEGFAYRQIKFGTPAEEKATALLKALDDTDKSVLSIPVGGHATEQWDVAYVPRGFVSTTQLQRRLGNRLVDQLLFSDGINTFSIFFRRLNTGEQCSQNVDVGRYSPSNVVVRHIAGHEVVLVGQMPLATLVKIADSIRFNTP